MASTLPQWSDLPTDVLGQVLARVPLPGDRARFRAVCRSWRSTPGWRLPWIVHRDGTFVTFPDCGLHRLPLPDKASFLGATNNGWLALERAVEGKEHARSYSLYNPFTGATLPLLGLESVIVKVSKWFEVRKVLMRSTVDDVVVVTTNNWYYPVILCRAGKPGAWIPKPIEMPYACLIDVEFLGDRLYGITSDEELVAFDLGEDDEGRPTVSGVTYVIRHPTSGGEEEDMNGKYVPELYQGDGEVPDNEVAVDRHLGRKGHITDSWHLLASNGDLLMLRRQKSTPRCSPEYNIKIEVLKADMNIGSWVPARSEESQKLFISKRFCKCFPAPTKKLTTCYFVGQWDIDDHSSEPLHEYDTRSTWVFPPEVVL
ncbi:uncharacterized protein [Lolium perenne]|uniref:uncharacterized protein n=1 Tax=Lolium perenne TaxID=4522 RepID=UPI0021EA32CE|nr:uncharacterized protein LOC127315579 [Lolium perenne]